MEVSFTAPGEHRPPRGVGGEVTWGIFFLGMCRWPLRAPTPLWSILWPNMDPILVTFEKM